jgi:hypothetical protein
MKRTTLLFFPFMMFLIGNTSQAQNLEVKEKNSSNYNYKDFIIENNRIWGLTSVGTIQLFSAINGDQILFSPQNDSAILMLTMDRKGAIVIGDKSNSIKRYQKESNSWQKVLSVASPLLGITFDSKNNYYLITGKGIFDVASKIYVYPDSTLNHQIRHEVGWLRVPTYFTDKKDNIWIGFGHGEWGGELFIFSTVERKFITPDLDGFKIELNPIKSIFESDDHVFVTSGLMHFSTSGSIVQFDNYKAQIIFESPYQRKNPHGSAPYDIVGGEYIGPGTYNANDSCIYFYSQNGVFKGSPRRDLSNIAYWTKVFEPQLHWSNVQQNAVGSPMNVLKLEFSSENKLVFVSQYDGIGIYDGKTLVMTR